MEKFFGQLSVTSRLVTITTVVAVAMALIAFDVVTTLEKNKQDGTVINVAGRQRMLTKKFASEVMLSIYEGHKSQHAQLNYENTIKLYELTLQALKTGGRTFSDLGMSNPISIVQSNATEYKKQLVVVEQLWHAQKQMAQRLLSQKEPPTEAQVDAFMLENHKTLAAMHKAVLSYNAYAVNNVTDLKKDVVTISVVSFLMILILSSLISRSVINPLKLLVRVSRETTQGDLEDKPYVAELENKSELGKLASNISGMRHALSSVLVGLKTSADNITSLSGRVAQMSQEVNESYSEEQRKYDEITQLSEGVVSSFDQVSTVVEETLSTAEHSQECTSQGLKSVEANLKAVDLASQESQTVTENIQELSSVAEQVYSIIDVIQTIAEQTNLLALNAAIEAARAGEQGRGFAVVADEVRMLASKTNDSTEEISKLLNSLTERVSVAVDSVDALQSQVAASRECSKDTAEMIEAISSAIGQTVSSQGEISDLIRQQTTSIDQLKEAQDFLAGLLQQTRSKIDTSSQIAVDMSEMAQGITSTLDEFRLSKSQRS